MNSRISCAMVWIAWLIAATQVSAAPAWQSSTKSSSDVIPAAVARLEDRVVVVANMDSPVSVRIAKHYVKQRGVRKGIQVHCQDSALDTARETMAFADFKEKIEAPIKAYLAKDSAIDFIVLTKGIPIRLSDAPVGTGKLASLDSYLAAFDYFERSDV